jgi:hypothetical protein
MLIPFDTLIKKYKLRITGILHVGAHECEELNDYEKVVPRNKIIWVEAIPDKVKFCKDKYANIQIENAIVSDKCEEVAFYISNNGQSSSILPLGTHKIHHPHVHYTHSFIANTSTLNQLLHLFSFKTPILLGKNIRKNVKSIVGISPTMVLLFPVLLFYWNR